MGVIVTMQIEIQKEQKNLDITIQIIDGLLKEKKKIVKRIPKDKIEAQVLKKEEKDLRKLEKIRNIPYFGRLDFEDEYGKETIYIGKKGIEKDGEIVVVDWRTDIGKLYNAYQGVKSTFYLNKEQNRPVKIHRKRGIHIKDGKVIYVTDIGKSAIIENDKGEKVKYMDDYLKEILSNTSEGHQLKDIISSIQAEQDEIIRLPLKDSIIVQGAAGSGKSTIALHRISYLLYQYHETLKPDNILILAPNEIFLSYIREIVPELEVDGIEQRTFYDWASTYFTDVRNISQLHDDYIDVYSAEDTEDRIKVSKYKGSLRFKKLLDDLVEYIGETMIPHGDIVIDADTILTKQELDKLYQSKLDLPLNIRMREIKDYIVNWARSQIKEIEIKIESEFEDAYQKWVLTLPEGEERKEVYEALEKAKHLRKEQFKEKVTGEIKGYIRKMDDISALIMYKSVFQKRVFDKFHPDIDEELLSLLLKNGKKIKQEQFSYEDIAPLIYLDAKINGKQLEYEHIVIDEAQDYSPFQLAILKDYAKSMTILGDIAQGIFSFYGLDRWEEIENYKDKNMKRLNIQTSYRSTKQIMDLANRVLLNSSFDFPLVIPVNRNGDNPTIQQVDNLGELYDSMVFTIDELVQKGYKKIVILTETKQGAIDTFDQLSRKGVENIEVITESHQELRTKITVIPTYLVKGLEFDAVIIEDVSNRTYKDTTLHAKMLYMSITRAHHYVKMYYRGELSPLLEDHDPNAPPRPRASFVDWLITDIHDPYTEPEVVPSKIVAREESLILFTDDELQQEVEYFKDDRERYYDFQAWLKIWRRWAEVQKERQR